MRELNEGQMAEWRGRTMGIVFQFFQLLPTLTHRRERDAAHGPGAAVQPARALRPGASTCSSRSGSADDGQVPRDGLGRPAAAGGHRPALANDPAIVVADEPTGNLDTQSAETVFTLFETLAAAGKTIVMVTHDDELAERASRTVVLADGLIVDEIVRGPRGPFT